MAPLGLLVVLGVGVLMVLTVRKLFVGARERRMLQTQHPNEPWMGRRDWAERMVRDTSPVKSGFLWMFAMLWLLISLPFVFVVRDRPQDLTFWFVMLFPLTGAGMMMTALYQTLRRRKYGISLCRLEHLPIPIGTVFRGQIEAKVADVPDGGFLVRLTSLRRTVSGSENRSTTETVLWQDEQTVGSGSAMPGPAGMRIPFHFSIPRDCEPVDDGNPRDSVLWRLEVQGDVPGIDYSARFELPVFRTADSDGGREERVWAPPWTPPPEIAFGLSRSGGEEIAIRPSRSIGEAIGFVIFLAFWFGALAVVRRFGAPLGVVLLFGAFGTLVLALVAGTFLRHTSISADRSALTIRHSWLGIGRTRTLPAGEVELLFAKMGSTRGNRGFYDVVVSLHGGRTHAVAKDLRSRRDAEGLAERIRQALGK